MFVISPALTESLMQPQLQQHYRTSFVNALQMKSDSFESSNIRHNNIRKTEKDHDDRSDSTRLYAIIRPYRQQRGQETTTSTSSKQQSNNNVVLSWLEHTVQPIGMFLAYSLVVATIIISWEDVTCNYALPSRHRTELLSIQQPSWGQSTVRGLGFGAKERIFLQQQQQQQQQQEGDSINNLLSLPTYNEVMLNHRTVTLPQWRQAAAATTTTNDNNNYNVLIPNAIHTIVASFQAIQEMQDMANDYQWDNVRDAICSKPLTELSQAGTVLRNYNNNNHHQNNNNNNNNNLQISTTKNIASSTGDGDDIIGFDWGSCAWRHCGAVADIQEALDELDYLLGVLEPFEAVFCLDIADRALRDIMTVIPWNMANEKDLEIWKNLPDYVSKVRIKEETGEESDSTIDEAYFQALQQFRVD